jgi:hypothetical protein
LARPMGGIFFLDYNVHPTRRKDLRDSGLLAESVLVMAGRYLVDGKKCEENGMAYLVITMWIILLRQIGGHVWG